MLHTSLAILGLTKLLEGAAGGPAGPGSHLSRVAPLSSSAADIRAPLMTQRCKGIDSLDLEEAGAQKPQQKAQPPVGGVWPIARAPILLIFEPRGCPLKM